jgi:hypothetical protein
MRACVSQAIRALPEAERVATTLYYLDGHTQNEIARFFGINSGAVSTRLHSARKRLRGRLEQMVREDVRENRPSRDEAFVSDVREYLRQFDADPEHADRSLLDTAWDRLDRLAGQDIWRPDEARAALDVCVHYGRQDRGNEILSSYLTQQLSVEEEAWARWHLTGGYAACRECARAVEEHRRFITWARASLPPGRWAWAFMAGGVANCWIVEDVAQQWLDMFLQITEAVPPTPETRDDRWILLRTAGRVLCELEQVEGVADVVQQMRAVAVECDTEGLSEDTHGGRRRRHESPRADRIARQTPRCGDHGAGGVGRMRGRSRSVGQSHTSALRGALPQRGRLAISSEGIRPRRQVLPQVDGVWRRERAHVRLACCMSTCHRWRATRNPISTPRGSAARLQGWRPVAPLQAQAA